MLMLLILGIFTLSAWRTVAYLATALVEVLVGYQLVIMQLLDNSQLHPVLACHIGEPFTIS